MKIFEKNAQKAEIYKQRMIENEFKINPEKGFSLANILSALKLCRNAFKFMIYARKEQIDELKSEIYSRFEP
jgi:hypothetical protein